jgi:anti-sigma B factor antagonist
MGLTLTTHCSGNVCIASLEGQMTLGPMLLRLSRELDSTLTHNQASGLILELSKLDDIDSAGLGELVNMYKSASDRRCRVAVTGANRRIREMFDVTRLSEFFSCYDDQASAESALRRAL